MAHEIETMAYVNEAPWHRLGIRLPADVRTADAMHAAGLDWQVAMRPVQVTPSVETPGDHARQVEGYRAVVRLSDGKPLGVVGTRYVPVQNAAAFEAFDDLIHDGQISFETAGALDGGRRIWVLAKLPGSIRVAADDVTEKFLLLSNSHDGSGALRVLFTPTRVVCQNTLSFALRRGIREGAAIRHTASAPEKMKAACDALIRANDYFAEFGRTAERLVQTRCTDEDLTRILDAIVPVDPQAPSTRTLTARGSIIELFSDGVCQEGVRGTAWAAVNAVAEYVDHKRPTRAKDELGRSEARLSSIWFGTGATLKQRAFDAIPQLLAA